ncbi:hypothetical protein [Burkholderia sp. IDO3]|uniref:hypothetical protein n=1 Tax=Burkholderia sp. IDO3 TaxID=1705310 RepID=UPI000BBA892E|nr:hypothetical protein [Burkholderia sp. IDO3]AXK68000.1 hypothetical protein DCN14_35765 [Burkholderia sp. IDO3]PCD59809.1 hypothetical protein CN645_22035 [Burkholderia sp. IDO3]
MKLNLTSTRQSLYRDLFALTADEINNIAIGTPVRVRLVAPQAGQQPSPRQKPEDAPTMPCAARTAVQFLD